MKSLAPFWWRAAYRWLFPVWLMNPPHGMPGRRTTRPGAAAPRHGGGVAVVPPRRVAGRLSLPRSRGLERVQQVGPERGTLGGDQGADADGESRATQKVQP